jgi:Mn-dependent DtxR family transcriptional regulator
MNGEVEGKTVGEKILLHLSRCSRFENEIVCPHTMTQQGIANKLGISREHVAAELTELRRKSRVASKYAHVPGTKTKRKVFYLTHLGQILARQLRELMSVVSPEWSGSNIGIAQSEH